MIAPYLVRYLRLAHKPLHQLRMVHADFHYLLITSRKYNFLSYSIGDLRNLSYLDYIIFNAEKGLLHPGNVALF